MRFDTIEKRVGGQVVKSMSIGRRWSLSSSDSHYSDTWRDCQICGGEGTDDMLYCSGELGDCPNSYHIRCLGLQSMPADPWLCAECRSREDVARAESWEESDRSDYQSSYGFDDAEGNSYEDYEDDVYDDEWAG